MSKALEKLSVAVSEPKLAPTLFPHHIEDHQAGIWRYLRALGCAPEEADDLTQETFLAVFRRPFNYLGRPAAASYLRRVAYHRFVAHLRDKRSQIELRDLELVDETWNRWHANGCHEEIFEVLAECFANLPERSRCCLEMRYRDGFSRQEIAAALCISEHGARNLIQRAKRRLRESIERRQES
jgi:RNA polymerase sigma-70 factor (ECF subfamily)